MSLRRRRRRTRRDVLAVCWLCGRRMLVHLAGQQLASLPLPMSVGCLPAGGMVHATPAHRGEWYRAQGACNAMAVKQCSRDGRELERMSTTCRHRPQIGESWSACPPRRHRPQMGESWSACPPRRHRPQMGESWSVCPPRVGTGHRWARVGAHVHHVSPQRSTQHLHFAAHKRAASVRYSDDAYMCTCITVSRPRRAPSTERLFLGVE